MDRVWKQNSFDDHCDHRIGPSVVEWSGWIFILPSMVHLHGRSMVDKWLYIQLLLCQPAVGVGEVTARISLVGEREGGSVRDSLVQGRSGPVITGGRIPSSVRRRGEFRDASREGVRALEELHGREACPSPAGLTALLL